MTMPRRFGLMFLCVSCVQAQYLVSARAGMVQFATGSVFVDADPLRLNQSDLPVLKNGQELRTEKGLVEVALAPGIFLRLGNQSAVRLINGKLEDTQVELERGTALVEVVDLIKGDRLRVKFADTRTEFKRLGLYRFELASKELRVFGGNAQVRAGDRMVEAGRGKSIQLSEALSISKFDPKMRDALHRWAAGRSFYLFTSNKRARERRSHWETTISGWSWNRDYGLQLYSPLVAAEYRRKLALDASDKANLKEAKDQLRDVDRAAADQQRKDQQQQTGKRPPGRAGQ